MLMARTQFRVVSLTLAVILALVVVTNAGASPPTSATGTFADTSVILANPRSDGGNTVFDLTATDVWTGTFTGTGTITGTLIIHADGSANFHDTELFTGTVNGASGTVTFHLEGTGRPGTPPGTTIYQDTHTILGGTGSLANLHGVLNLTGTVPAGSPVAAYTGNIHFDP
jgi:hypothetical protein